MFKSKEALIEENLDDGDDCESYNEGLSLGVESAFSSIAERIKFYETYMDAPMNLCQDFPSIYEKIPEDIDTIMTRNDYNNWLFHFCFDGVK